MSAPPKPRIWMGKMPDGIEGFSIAVNPAELESASLVVFGPPPNPRATAPLLERLSNRGVPVVVCFDGPPDPFVLRTWAELGAWCISRADHTELVRLVDDIERRHEPGYRTRLARGLDCITQLELKVRTIDEVEPVACLLASTLPNPGKRMAALVELLLNAVEHGNLAITASEKQELLQSGRWREELDRRARTLPWSARVVTARLSLDRGQWTLEVIDQGDGFTPTPPPASQSPSQLHGRGIALARAAFDSIEWSDGGRRVCARVSK